jgi:2-iminoacetate synthase
MLRAVSEDDFAAVEEVLAREHIPESVEVREILAAARELRGLTLEQSIQLLAVDDAELSEEICETARFVKDAIYGNRVVLFAPLYISNLCRNDCTYCAFRLSNRDVTRTALSMREIRTETEALLAQGHKRLLLVSGEAYPERRGLRYVFDALDTIYSVQTPAGNIRRVNVNVAPLTKEEFRELKTHRIGTYQMFQETYHEPTYRAVHPRGPKADFAYRLGTVARAFEAGIDDVGVGVLFGLAPWRYEVVSLLAHIASLEARFGIGPHTISFPRIEPADGSLLSEHPPHAVSDADFRRIIAVLRLSVPYTGMILSTRETPEMRREALSLGISQMSAGSRTNPGGYANPGATGQFSLGDTRSLSDVIADIVSLGHVPSFCTGCYRRGRVGKDFMDLAKPGLIKLHCLPNAVFSFAEYLHESAPESLQAAGFGTIAGVLADESVPQRARERIGAGLARIARGERDVYV